MKSVRGKVSTLFVIVEIMRVFIVSPRKQENGCFDQTTLCHTILREINKIESWNGLICWKRFSKFWLFPYLKRELHDWNFEIDAQVIQEIQMIFGCIRKEFETTN